MLKGHLQASGEAARMIWRHRTLLLEMSKKDISERYSGQALGMFWAIAHPLFMICLYMFVFVIVFKTKITTEGTTVPLDYTTYILSGLIPWLAMQESLSKSTTVVTANANLIKQVLFPIELLPIKTVLASTITQCVSTLLLLSYVVIGQGAVWSTFLLLPLLMFFQTLFAIGLGFLLSSTGAFFRDLKDVVLIVTTAGVYLLPIFYLPEWVPPLFQPLIYANPFSAMVWCYQDAVYHGSIKHPGAWLVFPLLSLGTFIIGYRVMRRLKPFMGNVL